MMKALSIKQPWAYCITNLDKRVENRTWAPPAWAIGLEIAIHASNGKDTRLGYMSAEKKSGVDLWGADLPLGAIVGTAVIDRAIWAHADSFKSLPACQLKWYDGNVGWVLRDVFELPFPIPCSGALGLWNIPVSALAEIKNQMKSRSDNEK